METLFKLGGRFTGSQIKDLVDSHSYRVPTVWLVLQSVSKKGYKIVQDDEKRYYLEGTELPEQKTGVLKIVDEMFSIKEKLETLVSNYRNRPKQREAELRKNMGVQAYWFELEKVYIFMCSTASLMTVQCELAERLLSYSPVYKSFVTCAKGHVGWEIVEQVIDIVNESYEAYVSSNENKVQRMGVLFDLIQCCESFPKAMFSWDWDDYNKVSNKVIEKWHEIAPITKLDLGDETIEVRLNERVRYPIIDVRTENESWERCQNKMDYARF